MPFVPSHRNPDELQPEICDVCGNLRPRARLVELQIEGLRGKLACDLCLKGNLKRPSFRDHLARRGRRPQQMPTRLPPFGGEVWFDTEAE